MKYLLLLVLLLSGCTPYTNMNKAKSQYLCKDHGFVYRFKATAEFPVECLDGTKFSEKELIAVIMPVVFAMEYVK